MTTKKEQPLPARIEVTGSEGKEWRYLADYTSKSRPGESYRERVDKLLGVFKDGVRVAQVCTECLAEQPLSRFSTQGSYLNRVCNDCRSKRAGTVSPGKARTGRELAEKGLRRCTSCQEAQPLDEKHFRKSSGEKMHGFNYTCLTCKPLTARRGRLPKQSTHE